MFVSPSWIVPSNIIPSQIVPSHITPSWIVPSQITGGEYHYSPWSMNRYPHSFKVPFQVESSSPVPSWCYMRLWLYQQSHHCCAVVWSASQLIVIWLLGKHSAFCLNLGQAVKCRMLAVMLVAGYWKCLTTMGPTLGTNFCHGCFTLLHWAHGIKDTNTLSWDVYTYLFTSSNS